MPITMTATPQVPRDITLSPTALLLGVGLIALNFAALYGTMAAALFLVACLWLVLRRPGDLLVETREAWLLWALVLWCLLSTFWSAAPQVTLRHATQLGLTFAIAIAAAWRISISSLLRILLATGLLSELAAVALNHTNGGGPWVGMFGSKNALAQFSTICVISGWAILLDRRGRGAGWVAISGIVVLLGLLLLVKADSVGAVITTVCSGFVMLSVKMMGRLSHWQKIVLGLALALCTLCVGLFIVDYFQEVSRFFLKLTGKSPTMTGRTVLWQAAIDQISQHPLLGQGFQAFWVPGNPVAEKFWQEFDIASKTGFNFQNTLLSNAVEIGLVGIALQAAIFFLSLFVLVSWAIRSPSAESLFLAGFMTRQFMLMGGEVVFFFQFDPASLLTVMAAIYALRVQRERRTTRVSPLLHGLPVARHLGPEPHSRREVT